MCGRFYFCFCFPAAVREAREEARAVCVDVFIDVFVIPNHFVCVMINCKSTSLLSLFPFDFRQVFLQLV